MSSNGVAPMEMFDVSQPRVTAHQFVHDTLRRAILSGALAGGARLVQADLATQLSVSTTPVREALRDLTVEGLVEFRPHIGAVVRELDMEALIELYEVRKALEPLSLRRAAARITPAEMAEAEALQKLMNKEKDPAAWTELNWQFHSVLERAAHSPFLQSVVKSVQDVAAIYVAHSLHLRPNRLASGNREHRALLTALRSGDVDAAAAMLVQHLDNTLDSILEGHDERRQNGVKPNGSKPDSPLTGGQPHIAVH
jgi:DNA-binding GntR family transcriptional regulator